MSNFEDSFVSIDKIFFLGEDWVLSCNSMKFRDYYDLF